MALQDILDQKEAAETAQTQGAAVAQALGIMVNVRNVILAASNQLASIAAGGSFETIGADYKKALVDVKDDIDAHATALQLEEPTGILA